MLNFDDFFATYARLSRKQLAIYADVEPAELDSLADDLDLPERLTLAEAQQLLALIESDTEDECTADDDDESDESDDDDDDDDDDSDDGDGDEE
jgi:hypothetical protein